MRKWILPFIVLVLAGGYWWLRPSAEGFRWSDPGDPYLLELRTRYQLDGLVEGQASDYARAQAVTRWVHGLWPHDGGNEPGRSDPISIIEAARKGERFRCVEYSSVLAGSLTSIGIPARVLGLKTADVETREFGAGHVVTEAYLPDMQHWVMLDGQWGASPELNGQPLSALEFREALTVGAPGLVVAGVAPGQQQAYLDWIRPYLYYLDVSFDNRVGLMNRSSRGLMLVPQGSPAPRVFQRVHSLGYLTFTDEAERFYPVPSLK